MIVDGWVRQKCRVSQGRPTDIAFSWARPATLQQTWIEEECFYFFFTPPPSIHFPLHPCPSLSSHLLSPFFPLSPGDDTKWPTKVDVSLNPNTVNKFRRRQIDNIIFVFFPENMFWHLKFQSLFSARKKEKNFIVSSRGIFTQQAECKSFPVILTLRLVSVLILKLRLVTVLILRLRLVDWDLLPYLSLDWD